MMHLGSMSQSVEGGQISRLGWVWPVSEDGAVCGFEQSALRSVLPVIGVQALEPIKYLDQSDGMAQFCVLGRTPRHSPCHFRFE